MIYMLLYVFKHSYLNSKKFFGGVFFEINRTPYSPMKRLEKYKAKLTYKEVLKF